MPARSSRSASNSPPARSALLDPDAQELDTIVQNSPSLMSTEPEPFLKRPITSWPLALLGVLTTALAASGLWGFLQSPFARMSVHEFRKSSKPAGFVFIDVFAFVGFIYLLPVGMILVLTATHRILKDPQKPQLHRNLWLGTISFLCLASVSTGAGMAKDTLRCGLLFCMGNQTATYEDPNGLLSSFGLWIVVVMGGCVFMFLLTLVGNLRRKARSIELGTLESRLRARRLWRACCGAVLAAIVLPVCLLLTAMLPNTFMAFHVAGGGLGLNFPEQMRLDTWDLEERAERSGAWFRTLNVRLSEDMVLKFYPDTVMFYVFLETLALGGILSALWPALGRRLIRKNHRGFQLGETIVFALLSLLLVPWSWYWLHDHSIHSGKLDEPASERIARWLGLTGVLFMALALLPATKNSMWHEALGISWDVALWVHRWLGNCSILLCLLHAGSFWYRFAELGILPHDAFSVPLYYPWNGPKGMHWWNKPSNPTGDDWTIPMMHWVGLPSLILIGLTQFKRKASWEIFKYVHFMFLALVPAVLLHAASGWYFLLGGVSFWLVDVGIRFVSSVAPIPVLVTQVHEAEGGVTQLSFELPFTEPGQYCLVSVPVLSTFEWHPFSLCSSPLDPMAQMYIKTMGPQSFTGKLLQLARDRRQDDAPIMLAVDGPYGVGLDPSCHEAILCLAGGIGITPLHSCFRYLNQLSVRGELPATLRLVKLVWVARTTEMIMMLMHSIMEIVETVRPEGAPHFAAVLYLDNPHTDAASERGVKALSVLLQNGGGDMQMLIGRPALEDVYRAAEVECPRHGTILVRACGPPVMVRVAEVAASSFKRIEFKSELFAL